MDTGKSIPPWLNRTHQVFATSLLWAILDEISLKLWTETPKKILLTAHDKWNNTDGHVEEDSDCAVEAGLAASILESQIQQQSVRLVRTVLSHDKSKLTRNITSNFLASLLLPSVQLTNRLPTMVCRNSNCSAAGAGGNQNLPSQTATLADKVYWTKWRCSCANKRLRLLSWYATFVQWHFLYPEKIVAMAAAASLLFDLGFQSHKSRVEDSLLNMPEAPCRNSIGKYEMPVNTAHYINLWLIYEW